MDMFALVSYLLDLILLLAIMSMLWRDNPLYRWAVNTFLATSIVVFVLTTGKAIYGSAVQPLLKGDLTMLVPLFLGCLIFANQFGRRWNWISRYPIWILMGVGSAFAMRAIVTTQITQQIATILSRVRVGATADATLNNFIHVLFPIATFCYFFFYFMHRTLPGRAISKFGRYCIMFAFGVAFSGAMMYNMAFITYQLMWGLQIGPPEPIQITAITAVITVILVLLLGYHVTKYEDKRAAAQ